jgi:hypothetical protein
VAGKHALFSGDTGLPETCLLVFIQRADVDVAEDLLAAA